MFTLVILYTLYTSIYLVCTYVYPSNTVYLIYPYNYILCTHVYPSNTVYPYISCVPMFILGVLYTLYTPIYPVYPCLPQ